MKIIRYKRKCDVTMFVIFEFYCTIYYYGGGGGPGWLNELGCWI